MENNNEKKLDLLLHYLSWDGTDLEKSIYNSLSEDSLFIVIDHTKRVVEYAKELALRFGMDQEKAKTAALLHDISALIPNSERLRACQIWGIDVSDEEQQLPLLTHQKLSAYMAEEIYGVLDKDVLSAIGCHTTLHENPSDLDLLIFIADKLEWDQEGVPPFYDVVASGLNKSLEEGVFAFMDYMLSNNKLRVVHSSFVAGYETLKKRVGK